MRILGKAADRHGRIWEARILTFEESAEEDLRFWQEEMTGEQRVIAAIDCSLACHSFGGTDELPRRRGVSRVVQRSHG